MEYHWFVQVRMPIDTKYIELIRARIEDLPNAPLFSQLDWLEKDVRYLLNLVETLLITLDEREAP